MKTKEEWCLYFQGQFDKKKAFEQIQLDAMKEGMRRAADCAISDALMNHHDAEGRCNCGNCSARRAILTAVEQLAKETEV